jgi:hypothetical protein
MDRIIDSNSIEMDDLDGFIEDNDVFDFYLKYKGDIDELLMNIEFFNDPPKDNDIYSLYDFIIIGTKNAVFECMKIIQTDMT